MQGTNLICTTNPELEEALSLRVESATVCKGGQQDVGCPKLVHPVVPVLVQNRGVLQNIPHNPQKKENNSWACSAERHPADAEVV